MSKQGCFYACLILAAGSLSLMAAERKPNVLFILTDQWRAQAMGHAGDPNVKTPVLDKLAAQSLNFTQAVSGMPVCCPMRASLMTGQRPLTHGVFMNDVQLNPEAKSLGKALVSVGYTTGYIGKWHIDGRGRSSFIPPERRQGFEFWRAQECTHNYNNSFYYADEPVKLKWPGYDSTAQAIEAMRYMREKANGDKPFALFLSWGTPHAPYHTAPQSYRDMYSADQIVLRPNVPDEMADQVKKDLAGYYAHCSALDDLTGQLLKTLRELGIERNTIVVFTADHGDMLGSQGAYKKQRPYEESARVPMLWRYPAQLGDAGKALTAPMNSEDIMPTLLNLCGVSVPESVEGLDFSRYMKTGAAADDPTDGAALLTCVQPFGQWHRGVGGREYRALRTAQYTYARGLDGPWLLFDNVADPYQMKNLVEDPAHAAVCNQLDQQLTARLKATKDEFLSGKTYLAQWKYEVDDKETVPYSN